MPIFRNTIRKSRRERVRHVDRIFEIILKVFIVGYFLFVLSAWLSYRPAFRISEVTVEGARAVDVKNVHNVAEAQLARHLLWKIDRNNALLYPRSGMRLAIMAVDTRIKSADLVVSDKQLTVRLSEYSPSFLWCPPESATTTTTTVTAGCYFADSAGHIFAPAPEYSGNPFLVFMTTRSDKNKSAVLPQEEFTKINIFLRKLNDFFLTPRTVRQSGANDFTITTDQSWEIRWSSARDPEEDAHNLALVLENLSKDHMSTSTLKSVDLRFGNKVFYR